MVTRIMSIEDITKVTTSPNTKVRTFVPDTDSKVMNMKKVQGSGHSSSSRLYLYQDQKNWFPDSGEGETQTLRASKI